MCEKLFITVVAAFSGAFAAWILHILENIHKRKREFKILQQKLLSLIDYLLDNDAIQGDVEYFEVENDELITNYKKLNKLLVNDLYEISQQLVFYEKQKTNLFLLKDFNKFLVRWLYDLKMFDIRQSYINPLSTFDDKFRKIYKLEKADK